MADLEWLKDWFGSNTHNFKEWELRFLSPK